MNARKLQSSSEKDQRAHARGEWGLMLGLLLAAAVVLVLAGRGVPAPAATQSAPPPTTDAVSGYDILSQLRRAASQTPSAINNHLYVPCSVGGCDPARTSIMNNHLYVPCSVSGCHPTTPVVINNHLYIPCSVQLCERTH